MVGVVGSSPIAPTNININTNQVFSRLDVQVCFTMVQITLPDGSTRSFDHPVTVAQVAESIGAGLAKAALAGRVNDTLVDTSFPIEADSRLAIVTEKDPRGP